MITLRLCELEFTPEGAVTHFRDNTRWGALPHPEMPHYVELAHRMGHDGDTLAFCRAHELSHHVISEALGSHSLVIWALAHDEKPCAMVAAAEESLTMHLHRYAMTNEHPYVDCVDWPAAKTRFLSLWGQA